MELSLIIVKPVLPSVTDSLKMFKSKRTEPVIEVEKPGDAIDMVINGLPCVIVMSIQEDADIIACLQMMKTISPDRKDKLRRVVVVSRIQNTKLNNSLLNRGVVDVLHDRVSPTAMVFKFSLHLSQVQRLMKETEDSTVVKGRAGADAGSGMSVVSGANYGYQSTGETLANDIWFLRGASPKKVGVQWMTDMDGPDPDSGQWEQVENEGLESWKWIPFGADGKPNRKTPSSWQFDGNRPIFDTDLKKWRFVAAKPRLYYHPSKGKPECKLSFDPETGLSMASDNPDNEGKLAETKRLGDLLRRDREKNAPLPNATVSASQLGTGQGEWETVDNVGWTYVTPEMDKKTPDKIREQKNIWTLDKAPGVRKPVADLKGENWTMNNSELPKCNDSFDDLPAPYQNYLLNRKPSSIAAAKTKAQAQVETQANDASQRANATKASKASGRADQTLDILAGEGLKFFFQLSKMSGENRSESEMIQKIVLSLRQLLKLDNVTLIAQHSQASKRHALLVYSTHIKFTAGSTIDLEAHSFQDALTDLQPKHQGGSGARGISTYPLIYPTQSNLVIGSLILEYDGERQVQNDPNFKAVGLVSRHLARILKPAKAA